MNVPQASMTRDVKDEIRMTGQQGIALLTVMLMLLILSILGIASITVTSMENRMAGFFARPKQSWRQPIPVKAFGVNIIQQTLSGPGILPTAFVAPTGPVPSANATILWDEINGFWAASVTRATGNIG